jgi:hypothetical protein
MYMFSKSRKYLKNYFFGAFPILYFMGEIDVFHDDVTQEPMWQTTYTWCRNGSKQILIAEKEANLVLKFSS